VVAGADLGHVAFLRGSRWLRLRVFLDMTSATTKSVTREARSGMAQGRRSPIPALARVVALALVAITAITTLVVSHGGRAHAGQPAAAAPSTTPASGESGPPSPSTAEMAFVGTAGGVWALELDGTTSAWAGPAALSEFCDTTCKAARLEWSPDGRTLAVLTTPASYSDSGAGDVTVQLMSPGGGDLRPVFACPDVQCERSFGRSLAWSPDSGQLAVTVGDDLYVADADGSSPRLVCTCKATPATYLRDGRLATVDERGLAAIDPDTRVTTSLAAVPHAVSAVWAPDRTVALVTMRHRGSVVVNVVSHTMQPAQRLHATAGAWSPNSFPYAFTVQRTLRHPLRVDGAELWITGPNGRGPRLVHRFPDDAGDVRRESTVWSPDGSRIAIFFRPTGPHQVAPDPRSGKLRIVDVRSGKVLDAFAAEGGVAWREAG
jgi:hypothetical protein